ncbi:MAG: hypothetical protein ACLFSJ_00575 [Halorhodospira sp.]
MAAGAGIERWLPEELATAGSQLVERLRQRSVRIPIPERVVARSITRVGDPSLRDLALELGPGGRLRVSGLKRKGIWIPFSVGLIAVPPSPGAPGPSVDLYLERVSPFFAGPFVLRALGQMPEMEPLGSSIRIRLDRWIDRQEWASPLPRGVLERVQVVDVTTDTARRALVVTLGWGGGGG